MESGDANGGSHSYTCCLDSCPCACHRRITVDPEELARIVEGAVRRVEAEHRGLKGAEKHQLAVELVNSVIDVPLLSEAAEARVIALMLDALIKLACKLKPIWKMGE